MKVNKEVETQEREFGSKTRRHMSGKENYMLQKSNSFPHLFMYTVIYSSVQAETLVDPKIGQH